MASSEARRGGSSPPIGLWSMQNRTFLVVLRRIFCEKLKIAPPIRKQPPSNVWISDLGGKNQSQNRWRPFFFGDHLILGGKKLWIPDFGRKISLKSGEDLFFLFLETTWVWAVKTIEFSSFPRNSVSIFGQTVWNWFKINENSDQGRLQTSHSFKIAPPPLFPNSGYAPVYGTATWRSGKGRGLGKTKFLLRIPVAKEVDPKTPPSETLPLQPISTKTNL